MNCRITNLRWKVREGEMYMDLSGNRRGPLIREGSRFICGFSFTRYDAYGKSLHHGFPDLCVTEPKGGGAFELLCRSALHKWIGQPMSKDMMQGIEIELNQIVRDFLRGELPSWEFKVSHNEESNSIDVKRVRK